MPSRVCLRRSGCTSIPRSANDSGSIECRTGHHSGFLSAQLCQITSRRLTFRIEFAALLSLDRGQQHEGSTEALAVALDVERLRDGDSADVGDPADDGVLVGHGTTAHRHHVQITTHHQLVGQSRCAVLHRQQQCLLGPTTRQRAGIGHPHVGQVGELGAEIVRQSLGRRRTGRFGRRFVRSLLSVGVKERYRPFGLQFGADEFLQQRQGFRFTSAQHVKHARKLPGRRTPPSDGIDPAVRGRRHELPDAVQIRAVHPGMRDELQRSVRCTADPIDVPVANRCTLSILERELVEHVLEQNADISCLLRMQLRHHERRERCTHHLEMLKAFASRKMHRCP